MPQRIIKTKTAHTMLGDDGIVRVRMLPDTTEDRATALENVAAFIEVCDGIKRPLLIDMTGTRGATQEARRAYSTEDMSRNISASAMVVPSPVTRVLGRFFLSLNKPRHLLRLFTSEDEAIQWLKGYR